MERKNVTLKLLEIAEHFENHIMNVAGALTTLSILGFVLKRMFNANGKELLFKIRG
ncbi:hypothetical protein ABC382_00055 [Lysinibacillus sp. 1P01SD]|uniref:hypothetical protein n=1 Tax=Lysinibacillus sp. 1P01SD TaxID=3132285 RepID=UPI0039A2E381